MVAPALDGLTHGLVDRLLAVLAMLAAVRPIVRASTGQPGHLSWKRALVLAAGGLFALAAVTGLLVARLVVLDEPALYLPTWLGGTLSVFGGMLGMATLLAGRRAGPSGHVLLSEDAAIRHATLAAAMSVFLVTPRLVLAALGVGWLLRAVLPVAVAAPGGRRRVLRVIEAAALIGLSGVPREATVGGLRAVTDLLGGG